MEDGVDDLEAALSLLTPHLGVWLAAENGARCRITRDRFHVMQTNSYDRVVLEWRGIEVHTYELDTVAHVLAGDVIDLRADSLAKLIYTLIDRGAFLSD